MPAHAQNIPDANFAAAIRTACPTCIDAGNNLLSPAANLTSLDVRFKNISDLTGIGGFTNLRILNVFRNNLTSLPTLPTQLTDFKCHNNKFTSLPTLPNTLTIFNCGYNPLTSLPNPLPSNLIEFSCASNSLISLPTLLNTLQYLDCSANLLTSLPNPLPSNLTQLVCASNSLTSLPTLLNTLQSLLCFSNQLTSLPTLPSTLFQLVIDGAKITCLPNLIPSLHVSNGSTNGNVFTFTSIPTPPLCAPLPIELLTFSARPQNQTVLLNWQTAAEEKAAHFDIERSGDGKLFEKVGTLKAINKANNYDFTDNDPLSNLSYYRLKLVDLDGQFTYAKTVSVDFNTHKTLKIYPNPSQNDFTIELPTSEKGVLIEVFDVVGKSVFRQNTEGVSIFKLSATNWQSGVYFLKISNQKENWTEKMIKL